MPIGNPVTLTSNVASKTISDTATASQTLFNVTGGYRINSLGVFKNGSRLQDGVDYIARDGLTVTLLSAASGGDKLQFVVFDTFRVAEAIRPAVDEQTIRGNLNVVGILSCTDLEGPVSLNITSGIQTFHDVRVGGALTVAGELTFEDVTNIDSVGYATFRSGVNVQGAGSTTTTLNVTGVATVGNNISIGDSIFHTGDGGGTTFGFPAADTFTVYTAGSERFRVDSSGNIGINSTGQIRQLEIYHGTHATATLNSETQSSLFFSKPTDTNIGQISYDHGSDFMYFRVNDAERVRIDSSGNVGINSTNPSYLLDIASGSAAMRLNSTSTSTLVITSGASNAARIEFGDLANNDTGYIYYDNSDDSMQFATNGSTERLRITSAGVLQFASGGNLEMASNGRIFVGNGGNATNPMFANVSDTNTGIAFPAADTMLFATGGTERLRITSDGKVRVPDSGRFTCGTDDDLALRHSGNTGVLENSTGHFYVDQNTDDYDIYLRTDDGSGGLANYVQCDGSVGSVILSHYGSTKFETTATGVTVTGTLNATTAVTQNGNALATGGKAIAMALIFG